MVFSTEGLFEVAYMHAHIYTHAYIHIPIYITTRNNSNNVNDKNTPFLNLFAVTTCHMKTGPYLVNRKQTDIRM